MAAIYIATAEPVIARNSELAQAEPLMLPVRSNFKY